MVMIARSGGDTGQVDRRPVSHLDHRRVGHPQIRGVGPMHMLDSFRHGAFLREVDGLYSEASTRAIRKASSLAGWRVVADGTVVRTFAIITTDANSVIAELRDRCR